VIVLAVPPQIIHRMRRPSWNDDARLLENPETAGPDDV
jgi:hypothetical protein